jgi:hypothetical protein
MRWVGPEEEFVRAMTDACSVQTGKSIARPTVETVSAKGKTRRADCPDAS